MFEAKGTEGVGYGRNSSEYSKREDWPYYQSMENEMQELHAHELDQVSGGIALLAPLAAALADTAGWGALIGAGAAGYGFGGVLNDMATHQGDDLTNYNLF